MQSSVSRHSLARGWPAAGPAVALPWSDSHASRIDASGLYRAMHCRQSSSIVASHVVPSGDFADVFKTAGPVPAICLAGSVAAGTAAAAARPASGRRRTMGCSELDFEHPATKTPLTRRGIRDCILRPNISGIVTKGGTLLVSIF